MSNYSCVLDECLYFNIIDALDIVSSNHKELSTLVNILTYNTSKDNLYICLTHMLFHYCDDSNICIKDEQNYCRLTGKFKGSHQKNTVTHIEHSISVYEKPLDDIVIEKYNQYYFFQYIIDTLRENNIEVQESESLMGLIVHLYEIFYKYLLKDKAKQRISVENRMKFADERLCNIINIILEYNLERHICTHTKDNRFVKLIYLIVSAYLVQVKNIHLSQQRCDILKQWIKRQKKNRWM